MGYDFFGEIIAETSSNLDKKTCNYSKYSDFLIHMISKTLLCHMMVRLSKAKHEKKIQKCA